MHARTDTRAPKDERFEVETWREEQLEESFERMGHGKRRKLAFVLAESPADLHQMVKTIEAGCPPDLVRAIFT